MGKDMPPAGRKGAPRGRGGAGGGDGGGSDGAKGSGRGGAQETAGGKGGGRGEADGIRRGAGRGIPDFKENPRSGKGGAQAADGEGNAAEGVVATKFNAQEAADWMASRYQAVVDEYEKNKASGRKGDIWDFSKDLNQSAPWTKSGPNLPPKEDFLAQLQMALTPFRARSDDKGGERGW